MSTDNPFGDNEAGKQIVINADPLNCTPVTVQVQPYDLPEYCRRAQRLSKKVTNNTVAHEAIVQTKKGVEAEAAALVAYAKRYKIPIEPGIPGVLTRIRQHQKAYQSIDPFSRVGSIER